MEIESVKVDILQLSARLASEQLTAEQIDLNSRFLLAAIERKQELSKSLKFKHGVNITILNLYKTFNGCSL